MFSYPNSPYPFYKLFTTLPSGAQSATPTSLRFVSSSGVYPWGSLTVGQQLRVVGSAVDTPSGIGVSVIRIEGLKYISPTEWIPWYEDVALNGTTPVLTVETAWIRIFCCYPLVMGTAFNASTHQPSGTIRVTNTANTFTYLTLGGNTVGNGGLKACGTQFTCPDKFVASVDCIQLITTRTGGITRVDAIVRKRGNYTEPFVAYGSVLLQGQEIHLTQEDINIDLKPGDDFELRVVSIGGGAQDLSANIIFNLTQY